MCGGKEARKVILANVNNYIFFLYNDEQYQNSTHKYMGKNCIVLQNLLYR